MPWSADEGKLYARAQLLRLGPKTVLDVGAGAGTYGKMVRSALSVDVLDAVEIHPPYIDRFNLTEIYDHVCVEDIKDFAARLTWTYDMIIMGDVVEHLEIDDAIPIVNRLKQFCRYMLVSLPIVVWEQGAEEGNEHEAHLHHWTHEEFKEHFPPMRAWTGDHIGVYVVKGDIA